jgi:hypothetical protein
MTREPKRDTKFEPVYDVNQRSGATVEVFYNDNAPTAAGEHSRASGVLPLPLSLKSASALRS